MSIVGSKTTDEIKDYTLDWSKDLGGDTIASSSWSISPADAIITQSSIAQGNLQVTAWVAGGSVHQVYQVKNTIVTAAGRDITKVFRLLVVSNNYL